MPAAIEQSQHSTPLLRIVRNLHPQSPESTSSTIRSERTPPSLLRFSRFVRPCGAFRYRVSQPGSHERLRWSGPREKKEEKNAEGFHPRRIAEALARCAADIASHDS